MAKKISFEFERYGELHVADYNCKFNRRRKHIDQFKILILKIFSKDELNYV